MTTATLHHDHKTATHADMDRAPVLFEKQLRSVMAVVFLQQGRKFANASKPEQIKFTDKDHKDVVDRIKPTLMQVFKIGGDKALKSIRKFPKGSREIGRKSEDRKSVV